MSVCLLCVCVQSAVPIINRLLACDGRQTLQKRRGEPGIGVSGFFFFDMLALFGYIGEGNEQGCGKRKKKEKKKKTAAMTTTTTIMPGSVWSRSRQACRRAPGAGPTEDE